MFIEVASLLCVIPNVKVMVLFNESRNGQEGRNIERAFVLKYYREMRDKRGF